MGSGVTPNQASSVIQMPSSYFSHILNRWNQYLQRSDDASYVIEFILLLQVSRELVHAQPLVDSILIGCVTHVAPDVPQSEKSTTTDSPDLKFRSIRTIQEL